MIIYDSTALAFIRKSEAMLKEILLEMGYSVRKTRFERQGYLYPIQVVVFEGREWGHFNAPFLQIGLNRRLVYSAKDSVLRDILRHELAHYLTYIEFGEVEPHGPEFRSICERHGFSSEVARATMELGEANEAKEGDLESERVLSKVKKLLQLAQSANCHEAELATVKANELLLRHNLRLLDRSDEEPLYLDRVLIQRRKDAKIVAIYEILRFFVVRPVLSFGRETCALEVSGSLVNVTLARYVAEFLHRELDRLWLEARAQHGLIGTRAKNSFFTGVARGFAEKMKGVKVALSPEDQRALTVVEKDLDEKVRCVYRRLSSSGSGAVTDGEARELGMRKGRDLTIRQGVETSAKNLYLPF
jgi:hypothetical protein